MRIRTCGPAGIVAWTVVAIATAVRPVAAQTAPPPRIAASILRVYGPGVRFDSVRVDSASVLRVTRHDSLLGFAEVRNARGKDQPITYLVAVGPDARLRDIDILVYREPYGGEVAYEPWRKQFRGKGADAPMIPGRDIQGISGATISVNAVTAGVRRALHELDDWRRRGLLR